MIKKSIALVMALIAILPLYESLISVYKSLEKKSADIAIEAEAYYQNIDDIAEEAFEVTP